jgi:hypothetical protein
MISTQSPFLAGAITTLAAVAALLFLRFYRRTRDPLFLLFAISFLLQSIGRIIILFFSPMGDPASDDHPESLAPFYILRLIAYGLIIFAIIHKNRARPSPMRHS